MAITEEFKQAIQKKDIRMVRIMLKDSLVVDPTFIEFNKMSSLAEANIEDLYDEHDEEVLNYEITAFNKEYMDEQMVKVIYNFSKERINLLKCICKYIYGERASQIEKERRIKSTQIQISKKQVGTGIALGGVVATAVGVTIAKPVIVATGIVAGIVGGVIIITDK
ncbi:hypothetical protein [uncultured Clostridium sp.]|uniref:hypothetical protein n=1 Tax=uncultured Clostridium sp. TaxID=59620 RepID=UPI00258BB94F|nr:hypothetical protein [uncultured Clostridium sp.]